MSSMLSQDVPCNIYSCNNIFWYCCNNNISRPADWSSIGHSLQSILYSVQKKGNTLYSIRCLLFCCGPLSSSRLTYTEAHIPIST
mmetsp:Transcript_63780/g.132832  ORF Transcript_63780/g.132832 Transcript_63780/m.132832 type:complete len:85 (-) Transcript_63780:896-1150(-)